MYVDHDNFGWESIQLALDCSYDPWVGEILHCCELCHLKDVELADNGIPGYGSRYGKVKAGYVAQASFCSNNQAYLAFVFRAIEIDSDCLDWFQIQMYRSKMTPYLSAHLKTPMMQTMCCGDFDLGDQKE